MTSWAAFVMPTGTPRPMIDKFNVAIKDIAAQPADDEIALPAGGRPISQHARKRTLRLPPRSARSGVKWSGSRVRKRNSSSKK